MWGPNTVPLAGVPCGGCVPRGWWRSQRRSHSVVPLRAAVAYCGGGTGPLWGASKCRRFPFPGCPPAGRAAGARNPCAVGAVVRVWGSSTVTLALSGGVAFYRCEGRPLSRGVPPSATRPPRRAVRVS